MVHYVMSSPIGYFFGFGFGTVYMDGQLSKYVLLMLCVSRVGSTVTAQFG